MPLLSLFALVTVASAQQLVSISGELYTTYGVPANSYNVELTSTFNHTAVDKTLSGHDGKFEFHNVERSDYTILVKTDTGDILAMQDIPRANLNLQNRIQIAEARAAKPISGTVSATQLLHRPPKKAIKEMNLAIQAGQAGDAEKAQEHLLATLRIDPDFSEAHTNLGAQYARAGRYEMAYGEFEAALRLGPKEAMQYCNLAVAALALNRTEEAEREVRLALQVDSRNSQSNLVLGRILAAQPGKYEEAVKHLQLASADIPNANVLLAQVYAKRGRKREAIAALENWERQAPDVNREQVKQMINSLR